MDHFLKLLIVGAHPDDPDIHAGGLAAIYRQAGHTVKMISLTNGDAGHHERWGPDLASRRRSEALAAGAVIGAEYDVWEHHDGQLLPTLELRLEVIREIRTFAPDLILTHRTEDYHPDHRATGHVVRDASYLITVPSIHPDIPILAKPPVIGYLPDRFTRPVPLRGDVVVDITEQIETVTKMLACHESQFFEWLPFNQGIVDQVPKSPEKRFAWLKKWYCDWIRPYAERYQNELRADYKLFTGKRIDYAEVFEISEYGAPLTDELRKKLFFFQ